MVTSDDVKKLAELARLALSEEEVATLQGEIASIVSYIDTVQKVDLPDMPAGSPYFDHENVMREDAEPHEAGTFSKAITSQFPEREGDYLKVKKILG